MKLFEIVGITVLILLAFFAITSLISDTTECWDKGGEMVKTALGGVACVKAAP